MTREVRDKINFADWLRAKRKAMNMNQQELADLINVHMTSIGRWEREEAYPTLDMAEDIISKLGGKLVIRERDNE